MKIREIQIAGYNVEIWNFGKSSFYYPTFNCNAEFKVNSNGFKQLSHYLRTCNWIKNIINDHKY